MTEEQRLLVEKTASANPVEGMQREDVAQELYLVMERCLANFDPSKDTKFSTYFINSAKNRIGKLRKQASARPRPVDDITIDYIPAPQEREPLIEELYDHLRDIPNGDLLIAYYVDGVSQEELARRRGVSQQRVQQIIKEGVTSLQKLFKRGGKL